MNARRTALAVLALVTLFVFAAPAAVASCHPACTPAHVAIEHRAPLVFIVFALVGIAGLVRQVSI